MYVLTAILITVLAMCLTIMVIFNLIGRYGGCGWGGRGACAKCTRAMNICLFTGWPMCTIMLCMLISIVVLAHIAPEEPFESGYVGTMTRAEYNTFAKMNGLDGRRNIKAKSEPKPVVVDLDPNGVCKNE